MKNSSHRDEYPAMQSNGPLPQVSYNLSILTIHIYSSDTHFVAESYPTIITFKPSHCLIRVLHPSLLHLRTFHARRTRNCALHISTCLLVASALFVQVNVEILAQSAYSTYHAFRSIRHQFKFKRTPFPSLPHVVHLVSLLDSQIRGCRASGGVLGFESRTRHVMFIYIP